MKTDYQKSLALSWPCKQCGSGRGSSCPFTVGTVGRTQQQDFFQTLDRENASLQYSQNYTGTPSATEYSSKNSDPF